MNCLFLRRPSRGFLLFALLRAPCRFAVGKATSFRSYVAVDVVAVVLVAVCCFDHRVDFWICVFLRRQALNCLLFASLRAPFVLL